MAKIIPNNQQITKIVRAFLYGIMAVCLANIISNFMQINLLNDYFVNNLYSDETYYILAEKNDLRVAWIALIYSIVIFFSIFVIGRWLFVSAKINHLSGLTGLKVSPGWSIGWYFIPFANLVMPYRSLRETYKASFNIEDWQDIRIPFVFPIWWTTWLLSSVLGSIYNRLSLNLEENSSYESWNIASYFDISFDIMLILNAVFLKNIVNTIYENQRVTILKEENI